ncbi:hypothetical protein BVC80_7991g5 [Macleaya cordata]|uniref:Uncharacterized protein n=1 Tax=Macleaya cordata TaxID=56857 RepID=A0A200PSF1_MACCD|nr:hypothetical protein BVC80_7991g5 [Macleaya cordata]
MKKPGKQFIYFSYCFTFLYALWNLVYPEHSVSSLPPHRRICQSIAFELKLGTGLCNGKGSPVVTLALRLHRDRLQQRRGFRRVPPSFLIYSFFFIV